MITQANTDGRRKYNGEMVNFFVHYDIDDDTSNHVLSLSDYGGDGEGAWVLLEEEASEE